MTQLGSPNVGLPSLLRKHAPPSQIICRGQTLVASDHARAGGRWHSATAPLPAHDLNFRTDLKRPVSGTGTAEADHPRRMIRPGSPEASGPLQHAQIGWPRLDCPTAAQAGGPRLGLPAAGAPAWAAAGQSNLGHPTWACDRGPPSQVSCTKTPGPSFLGQDSLLKTSPGWER